MITDRQIVEWVYYLIHAHNDRLDDDNATDDLLTNLQELYYDLEEYLPAITQRKLHAAWQTEKREHADE